MFSSSFFNRQSILVFYFPSIIFFTLFTATVVFATLSFDVSHCMQLREFHGGRFAWHTCICVMLVPWTLFSGTLTE